MARQLTVAQGDQGIFYYCLVAMVAELGRESLKGIEFGDACSQISGTNVLSLRTAAAVFTECTQLLPPLSSHLQVPVGFGIKRV